MIISRTSGAIEYNSRSFSRRPQILPMIVTVCVICWVIAVGLVIAASLSAKYGLVAWLTLLIVVLSVCAYIWWLSEKLLLEGQRKCTLVLDADGVMLTMQD